MRVLAFSDLHRDLAACARIVAAAGTADLVVGCGDFASAHRGLEEVLAALAPVAAKAVWVPGNNESLEALASAAAGSGATVLHGNSVERDGKVIAGLGGAVPPLPQIPWGSWDLTEAGAGAALAGIGRADLLVLHSPPRGIADRLAAHGHVGSVSIRAAVERLQPALALCGHIHDCWGERGHIGATLVANLGPTVNWFEL